MVWSCATTTPWYPATRVLRKPTEITPKMAMATSTSISTKPFCPRPAGFGAVSLRDRSFLSTSLSQPFHIQTFTQRRHVASGAAWYPHKHWSFNTWVTPFLTKQGTPGPNAARFIWQNDITLPSQWCLKWHQTYHSLDSRRWRVESPATRCHRLPTWATSVTVPLDGKMCGMPPHREFPSSAGWRPPDPTWPLCGPPWETGSGLAFNPPTPNLGGDAKED